MPVLWVKAWICGQEDDDRGEENKSNKSFNLKGKR